ncbi:MAG: 50S ribosomal protein L10 [Nanoarchaeota archaeon]
MVSEIKKQLVHTLSGEIKKSPLVGLVNMENLPGQQLQKMRTALKSKGVKMVMARKRLLKLALEDSKRENIQELVEKMKGMPALLFTDGNPFTLYSMIQKSKSPAAAKPGQVSPRDIVVKAGPTSFAPGPIISELAAVGIKTKVDAGKLTVISDTTIAKEGEILSQKVSDTLKRLDIKPMEIGLNLVAVWENGLVFTSKQLHIDEAEYAANLTQAAQWAFNLAVDCAYLTDETIELLLQKAFREAKEVGMESTFLTKDTTNDILARAEGQALEIKREGGIEAQIEPKAKEHHVAPVHKEEHHIASVHREEHHEPVPVKDKHQEPVPVKKEEHHVAPVHQEEHHVAPMHKEEHHEPVKEKHPEPKDHEHHEHAAPKEHHQSAPSPVKPVVEKSEEPVTEENKEPVHPSFGHVKEDQAKQLFEMMQKGGTLRDVNVKVKK